MCYSIYTQHKSIGEPATVGNPWRCRSFLHSIQGARNKRSGKEAVFYFMHHKQLWGNIYLFCLVGFLQCSFLSVFWTLLQRSFPPPPSLPLLLTSSLLKERTRGKHVWRLLCYVFVEKARLKTQDHRTWTIGPPHRHPLHLPTEVHRVDY